MIVTIHRHRDQKPLVPGHIEPPEKPTAEQVALRVQKMQHSEKARFKLARGEVYWLRLYAEPGEPATLWEPTLCDEINVTQFHAEPAEVGVEPPAPNDECRLIQRVCFQTFNDSPLRKLVRWRFRCHELDGDRDVRTYVTLQLPLIVAANGWRGLLVVGSGALGIFLAGLVDLFAALASGRDAEADFGIWGLTLVIALIGLIGVGFAILLALSRCWISAADD